MSKRKMIFKKTGKKSAAFVLAVLLAGITVFASGCDIPDWLPDWFPGQTENHTIVENYVFTIGEDGCTDKEIKVILADYQREFNSVYGIDMWTSEAADSENLISYIRESALTELANIYTLGAVAEAMDMELSSNESAEAKTAAKEYMDGLTEVEKSWIGISESELRALFEKYALARDLYETATEGISQEISDEEALVMDLEYIVVSDESQANELLSKLADGEDFDSVAAYSEEDPLEINVNRSTYDEDVTEQIFALNTGEYSSVIAIDGKYYIFYCTNYFDKELTEANKESVLAEKKEAALTEFLNQYPDVTESSLREDLWEEIEPDTSLKFEGPSFKELLASQLGIEW